MQRAGLHQHSPNLERLQQLAQGSDFAIRAGGVSRLGDP
jgi:hypothetical protein